MSKFTTATPNSQLTKKATKQNHWHLKWWSGRRGEVTLNNKTAPAGRFIDWISDGAGMGRTSARLCRVYFTSERASATRTQNRTFGATKYILFVLLLPACRCCCLRSACLKVHYTQIHSSSACLACGRQSTPGERMTVCPGAGGGGGYG